MTTRPHLWLRQGLCLITLPSSARSIIWRALILLGLAGLYAPVFSDIARTWLTQRYARHGVFVPAFSLFRVLWDWERIRAAAGRPNAHCSTSHSNNPVPTSPSRRQRYTWPKPATGSVS